MSETPETQSPELVDVATSTRPDAEALRAQLKAAGYLVENCTPEELAGIQAALDASTPEPPRPEPVRPGLPEVCGAVFTEIVRAAMPRPETEQQRLERDEEQRYHREVHEREREQDERRCRALEQIGAGVLALGEAARTAVHGVLHGLKARDAQLARQLPAPPDSSPQK